MEHTDAVCPDDALLHARHSSTQTAKSERSSSVVFIQTRLWRMRRDVPFAFATTRSLRTRVEKSRLFKRPFGAVFEDIELVVLAADRYVK